MSDVSPYQVLARAAAAVPTECHGSIVIIGSVAAGYQLLGHDASLQVRTKDIDCVLFPHVMAIESGRRIAECLLEAGWRHRRDDDYKPGTATTPPDQLPVVRLHPPNSKDWFLELLTVPDCSSLPGKNWARLEMQDGHYGIPSFRFLSVATFNPVRTEFGVFCARAEMMALANLLENPKIKPATMKGPIEGRQVKRSNKDLGRVLAIASLTAEEHVLASRHVTIEQLRLQGLRLIQDAIEPFEQQATR